MKEPHYYAYDYPGRREITTLKDYERLFRDALPGQIRGDGIGALPEFAAGHPRNSSKPIGSQGRCHDPQSGRYVCLLAQ